jgi:metal-sulfur cluster biosynthetic enzyme
MKPVSATASDSLVTFEDQLRLTQAEAESAAAIIVGAPALTARARPRFGPGRTCEPLARVMDRGINRAEEAGVDPASLVVVEATATAGEDSVRVRRNGYGSADWIRAPTTSVRIVLGWDGAGSTGPAHPDQQPQMAVRPPEVYVATDGEPVGAIRESLSEVIDPDLGVNIVDLGMVRRVALEDRTAVITMSLTSAACPLMEVIERQVEERLAQLPCIEGFRITWQWIPAWKPADITTSGRDQLRAIGFGI